MFAIVIQILIGTSIFFANYSSVEFNNILEEDKSEQFPKLEQKSLEFQIITNDLEISEIISQTGEKFCKPFFKDGMYLAKEGSPQIPFKALKVLLPYGYGLNSIDIKVGKTSSMKLEYKIEPAQERILNGLDGDKSEYMLNKTIYESNSEFPKEFYSIAGIQRFRGYNILLLNVYPIKYTPKTNSIILIEEMNLTVNLQSNTKTNLSISLLRNLKKDEVRVSSIVDNPEQITSYRKLLTQSKSTPLDLPSASYDYVIITNETLKNSGGLFTFQDLVNYKNSRGIETTIVTVEEIYASYSGRDEQEMIRNFIIDAYNNWGIEYVLLGGDADRTMEGDTSPSVIPARRFYVNAYMEGEHNITSDLYYACLDGTWNDDNDYNWGEIGELDLYAEIYIGRAPVDSEEELSNFIKKTLAHETSFDNYKSEAYMIGEYMGDGVFSDIYLDEIMYGSSNNGQTTVGFPPEYDVSTLYDRDLDPYRWNTSDIIDIINNGVHVICHMGHADTTAVMRMNKLDISSLENDKYFFGYTTGCTSGFFDNQMHPLWYDDCVVEYFLTSPNGAFGFIAYTNLAFYSENYTNSETQMMERVFFDKIFGEGIEEIGKANQLAKEEYALHSSIDAFWKYRWCYYAITLFGDPTANILPPPTNENPPEISDEKISTKVGFQNTTIVFNATYTDADNNEPFYINLVINETEYSMRKVDLTDDDYTDGCVYTFNTSLSPSLHNYSYYFECSDGKFDDLSEEKYDLQILIDQMPNANYSVNSDVIDVGDIAEFSFTGTEGNDPATYFWDFGDGYTSAEKNPQHSFLNPGVYYVYLNVTDLNGDWDIKNDSLVVIRDDPIANFSVNETEVNINFNVQFSFTGRDELGYLTEYYWDFGDGSTSLEMNPFHRYLEAGTFSVSLTIVDVGGRSHTEIKVDYIIVNENLVPIADFRVAGNPTVTGGNVLFYFNGSYGNGAIDAHNFTWDYGDGSAPGYDRGTTHQYLTPGMFDVTLIVCDADGDEDIITRYDLIVIFEELLPIANFTVNTTEISPGEWVQFNFSGFEGNNYSSRSDNFVWTFGDWSPNSYERDPIHQYMSVGSYSVTLIVRDADGDEDRITKINFVVVVEEDLQPIADFTANITEISPGEWVQFHFTGTEGNGPATYIWDFGDGSPPSYGTDPEHQFANAGTYSVTLIVSDADGDESSITKTNYIVVAEEDLQPIADFTANITEISPGEWVQFHFTGTEGNGPATYFWDFGDGNFASNITNPIHQYNDVGIYNVTLTIIDFNGDSDTTIKYYYIIVEDEEGKIPGFDIFIVFSTISIGVALIYLKKRISKV